MSAVAWWAASLCDEILRDFPDLTREDIRACLGFAADRERRRLAVPDTVLTGSRCTTVVQYGNNGTLPAPLAEQVRRVARERNLTVSRALVAPAERGVRAELEARENLKAAYHRFRKVRAIFRDEAIAEDTLR